MGIVGEPRVSVVIATYNYGQYLAEAIQSVIDQTYTDWELVVLDDGSTDDTSEIVKAFTADSRIHYHRQQNQGQPHAKNAGIRLSRGSLIAFLDADDFWQPTKLAKQVPLFDRNPLVGVTYTNVRRINPESQLLPPVHREMVRGDVLEIAIRRTIPPFSTSMVRRAVLDDVGLFDESIPLAIDYELWLRVALRYQFDYVDEPLMLCRTGHANLSRRSIERRHLVLEKILPRFLAQDGVRERLGSRVIAEAYADTFINQAREIRSSSMKGAMATHLRAVRLAPWMWPAWRSMVRCCVPDSLVQFVKSALAMNTSQKRTS